MAERRSGLAITATATAGILLVLVGLFHVVQGLVELIDGDFYAVTANWAFRFNVTTWGWLHLIGGLIALLTGFGLFTGNVLARTVAVIVAVLSAVASFMCAAVLPMVVDPDHRLRRAGDLGADRARSRHRHELIATTDPVHPPRVICPSLAAP